MNNGILEGGKETEETSKAMVTENFPHFVPDTNTLCLEAQR